MEDLVKVLLGGLYSSVSLILKLLLIILPLTISYEFLKLKEKSYLGKKGAFLGISKEGLIPLITGIFVGLTYGAGIIIHSIRYSNLSKSEAFLVLLFLSICHAIIEDTLIFAVIGADESILIFSRFFLTTLLTLMVKVTLKKVFLWHKLGSKWS
ncbi:MAG: hypothetical protein N2513_01010 [Deltaproteobacteria bacterium]|nr:hypothetical protein [Deltaproteobacteria bacterium]